jgi:hypothetical protein
MTLNLLQDVGGYKWFKNPFKAKFQNFEGQENILVMKNVADYKLKSFVTGIMRTQGPPKILVSQYTAGAKICHGNTAPSSMVPPDLLNR